MSCYRTPQHRRLRAELIRKWKPWEQSTGPRTKAGRAASARNSRKHSNRSLETLEQLRWLRDYLHGCREVA